MGLQGLVSFKVVFGLALFIRLLLVAFAEWQDANMLVKYTDIDYKVFTDASLHVVEGESPYLRSTYRYTPLLAFLLIPNITFHSAFGKIIFVICDLVIGLVLFKIIKISNPGISNRNCLLYVCTWLFHPFSINVSTRGNAESLVAVLVLLSLYFLFTKNITLGAFFYGLSVHFKIYPIIYSIALYLFIDNPPPTTKSKSPKNPPFFTKNRLLFFAVSASTFLSLTGLMYYLYGYKFLFETYLYHVGRTDPRHNFSVYFYQLYLQTSQLQSLLAFLPQLVLLASLTIKYYKQIELCLFLETLVFVAFNKVCTVQYFIWYFSLLPLLLPACTFTWRRGLALFALWFATQGAWLALAFRLEFLGENTFLEIWVAGIGFFLANMLVVQQFLRHTHCIKNK
eukprot:Phypoly_transcript_11526.p1 GENE.Phypoly_transcript_11526~~Phypoly_transcript_11526.p1  ORF type:complete len:396 (-),score=35.30 Phypoly_transcript_11526:1-1188(-)